MLLMFTQAMVGAVLGFAASCEAPAKSECCCQSAETRVWLVIEQDRLVLLDGELSESARAALPKQALVIGCRKFQSEAAAGGGVTGIKVRCDDVQFVTSQGISGRAAQLAYDSASRKLELRGSQGQPVELALESDSAHEMNLVATDMQIDLTSARFHLQGDAAVDPPVATCQCTATTCSACECCAVKQAAQECATHHNVGPACSAQADQINFDASRSLYILKSGGNPGSTIWHQHQAGAEASRADGPRIEYIPAQNHLRVMSPTGHCPCLKAPPSASQVPPGKADADAADDAGDASTRVLKFDVFRVLR